MNKEDPFTITFDHDDLDQYEEYGEDDLSELGKELGYITDLELADMLDELSIEDCEPDDNSCCDCINSKNSVPLSDYFENTVIPHEENKKIERFIESNDNSKALIPKNIDFAEMNSYQIAEHLMAWGINIINIDGLHYVYCESNGTYYCLNTVIGRSKFKNELSEDIRRKLSSKAIDRVIDEMITMPGIESRRFSEGNDGTLINFKDGVYNIFSGEVYPHSPKYIFTYCLNACTSDIKAESNEELFNQYLDNSFGDDTANMSNLQEMMGLALSTIRDQKMVFYLHGKSNSGKSVMLDLLKKIVGEEFYSSLSLEQLSSRFGAAHFLGKTLNVSGEAPNATAKRLDIFKTIVGNDSIMAEQKSKDGFYMQNYALFIFAANNMPEISAPDDAYYNRLRIIGYNRSVDKALWIKDLPGRLYDESLGAVLRFAVEGLKRFINNNMELTYIDTSNQYVSEYKNNANSFISFISCFVRCERNSTLLSSELFDSYNLYCAKNGIKPISVNKCSAMLLNVFPEAGKVRVSHEGSRGYSGLICTYPKNSAF